MKLTRAQLEYRLHAEKRRSKEIESRAGSILGQLYIILAICKQGEKLQEQAIAVLSVQHPKLAKQLRQHQKRIDGRFEP